MNPMDRLWSLGAGIVALALGLGAWFGVISPELSATATARDDLRNVQDLNAVHQLRIASLEEELARIDELRAERDALAAGIPGATLYSDFLRDLDAMAAAASVTIQGVDSGDPVAYLAPVAEAPAAEPAPAEGDTAEGEAEASSADASAAATGGADAGVAPEAVPADGAGAAAGAPMPYVDPRIGAENFAAVPFTISAAGDPAALTSLLDRLQSGDRIVSVTSASITAPDPAATDTTGTAEIIGFLYVLTTAAEVPAP
ncbi:hypothetical protein OVA14_00765 [Agrococcus sp. SL85]|uniref:hypothetical protein n=1 Tax=Agrococcus sp. SL85 TaxID=2995141 RepID=UPI00226CD424|nr:hypothetical protein [Agrococcus sp. SL85]WAC66365.1 hypothetical protein OVA14_00765 [Agrococcus sp. SL85]